MTEQLCDFFCFGLNISIGHSWVRFCTTKEYRFYFILRSKSFSFNWVLLNIFHIWIFLAKKRYGVGNKNWTSTFFTATIFFQTQSRSSSRLYILVGAWFLLHIANVLFIISTFVFFWIHSLNNCLGWFNFWVKHWAFQHIWYFHLFNDCAIPCCRFVIHVRIEFTDIRICLVFR